MSDENKKNDLTRLEDIGEFLHDEDDSNLDLDEGLPPALPAQGMEEMPYGEDSINQEEDEVPPFGLGEDEESSEAASEENDFFTEKTEEFDNPLANSDEETSFESESDFSNEEQFESSPEEESEFPSFDDDTDFENQEEVPAFDMEADDSFEGSSDDAFPPIGEEEEATEIEEFSLGEENSFEDSATEFSESEFEQEAEDEIEVSEDSDDFPAIAEDDDQLISEDFEEVTSEEQEIEEDDPMGQMVQAAAEAALQTPEEPRSPVHKESFEDVKSFAEHISYGNVSLGGNPPFSILIKHVSYEEDAEEIMSVLREHGLITPETEEVFARSLSLGSLLLSQLSEYAAIYLCHRLKRLNLELSMGPSEEIHPSKGLGQHTNKGLVSKKNLLQNYKEQLLFKDSSVEFDDIIIASTPILEGYKVIRYLGVASEHMLMNASELEKLQAEEHESDENDTEDTASLPLRQQLEEMIAELKKEHELAELPSFSLNEIYMGLAQKLKVHALKKKANAIIGINYHLIPFLHDGPENEKAKYQISCTGSLVWVERI